MDLERRLSQFPLGTRALGWCGCYILATCCGLLEASRLTLDSRERRKFGVSGNTCTLGGCRYLLRMSVSVVHP